MQTTANPHPNVLLPAGASPVGDWEPGRILDVNETRAFRLIRSADRQITDNESAVRLCATQYSAPRRRRTRLLPDNPWESVRGQLPGVVRLVRHGRAGAGGVGWVSRCARKRDARRQ
jgi:hypothetical protein